ncbi:MAG: hypothetical protein ISS71_09155 [Phycisphaerae bacterium]|nr:hypothetical protein [Phycisphaerae bacterium]
MPFTPYHFGPSGFAGLLFRRWLDVPVFVAVNVLIDVEVLADGYFQPGWPVHQLWHFHTLLVGGLAGVIFGAVVYYVRPLRWLCEKSMGLIGLPVKATLLSMVLAGLLGAWLHVFIDSFYHYDVQLFWPYDRNPMIRWARQYSESGYYGIRQDIKLVCRIFWGLMVGLYVLLLTRKLKKAKAV